MPCQDYGSNWNINNDYEVSVLKTRADMLARIACKAMTELERNGMQDFLLLKDNEVREWWEQHKIDDARAAAEQAEKRRLTKSKKEALAKLSAEERKLLGV